MPTIPKKFEKWNDKKSEKTKKNKRKKIANNYTLTTFAKKLNDIYILYIYI